MSYEQILRAIVVATALGCAGVAQAEVTLTPSLAVSERYTDNLFFSATRIGDRATFVSPGLVLAYEGRSWELSASYRGTAEYYEQRTDQNRLSHGGTAEISLPGGSDVVRDLELRASASITRTADLPAFSFDSQFIEPNNEGIQLPRIETSRVRAGATARYPWTQRVGSGVSYSYATTRYDSDEFLASIAENPELASEFRLDFQNSAVHDVGLDAEYAWSRRTDLSAAYGVSVTDFETARTRTTHRFTVGGSHDTSPSTTISGDIGLALVEGGGSQLTADARLVKTVEDGTYLVRYIRGVGTGGGVSTSVTLTQRLVGRATRDLTQTTSGYLQAAFGYNTVLPDNDVRTTTYETGAGLDVELLPWLTGGVSYSYLDQRTQGLSGLEGKRHLVAVTLAAAQPIRLSR